MRSLRAVMTFAQGSISMRSLHAGMTFGVSELRQCDSFSAMQAIESSPKGPIFRVH